MNWIMLFVAYTLGAMTMFAMFCLGYTAKIKEPINMNRVHFYVARDKNGSLWVYLNKPIRRDTVFECDINKGLTMARSFKYSGLSLNPKDFENLKWEDEPVEVFINLED